MSAVLTDAGVLHFSQKIAGDVPSNRFDAIELGTGNTAVSRVDTRAAMPNRITDTLVQVASGYPLLNDQDTDNPGRGPGVFSYRFDIDASVAPFSATNFILTNFQGGSPSTVEPVAYAGQAGISKPSGEVLTLFLNFAPTDVTVAQGLPASHAATHLHSGDDPIESGSLLLTRAATNYTAAEVTTGAPLNRVDAHLLGIDNALGTLTTPQRDYNTKMMVGGDPALQLTTADATGVIDSRARCNVSYDAVEIQKVVITNINFSGGSDQIQGKVDLAGQEYGFSTNASGVAVVTVDPAFEVTTGQKMSLIFDSISGTFTGVAAHFIGRIKTF